MGGLSDDGLEDNLPNDFSACKGGESVKDKEDNLGDDGEGDWEGDYGDDKGEDGGNHPPYDSRSVLPTVP